MIASAVGCRSCSSVAQIFRVEPEGKGKQEQNAVDNRHVGHRILFSNSKKPVVTVVTDRGDR
jgi:hypothetical protein